LKRPPGSEEKELRTMSQHVDTGSRQALLVEDSPVIRMMGMPVIEAVPARGAPYERTDPFILLHEGRFRLEDVAGMDTKHPHRGFDNLWYVLHGSASTGHTTGPDGSVERAHLEEGSLLWLRTGRGAWHAERLGGEEIEQGRGHTEFRSVLFWVNLARKDKAVSPRAVVLNSDQIPTRQQGDAIVRVLVGEGSPIELGTPASILDVELANGGSVTVALSSEFQAFAYMLDGEATFGSNLRPAHPPQLVLLGHGNELSVADAAPGTRFMVFAGKPYGEVPRFNGPFVD
jgi:redox-sensitive bicupin YhaK (pirin superfamily)